MDFYNKFKQTYWPFIFLALFLLGIAGNTLLQVPEGLARVYALLPAVSVLVARLMIRD